MKFNKGVVMNIIKTILVLIISIFTFNASALENCKWNNQKGTPCITISKTPNTSLYNSQGINKQIFTKQQIIESGATTTVDLLYDIMFVLISIVCCLCFATVTLINTY